MINKARLAAYHAIKSWIVFQKTSESFFENNKDLDLNEKDLRLAKEITFGVIRRYLTLEYFLEKLFFPRKVQLKKEEKILFWMALYQFIYLEKVPLYAIVNETVELAKVLKFHHLVGLYNALLRKIDKIDFSLPQDRLDIYYSFPQFFIEKLIDEYGMDKTRNILESLNTFFPPMVRMDKDEKGFVEATLTEHFKIISLKKTDSLATFTGDQKYYIQNITPILLMEFLSHQNQSFESILDLCASPGGKLLIAHIFYPKAYLFANDISQEKIQLLKNNINKYHVSAQLSIGPAESIVSDQKYDLIIVDAPCSNTGVLHKRPEARWRLDEEHLKQLQTLQSAILKNAMKLLKPKGQIWYMTCSILKEENEDLMGLAQKELGFKMLKCNKILPDQEGKDGGFAACLALNA